MKRKRILLSLVGGLPVLGLLLWVLVRQPGQSLAQVPANSPAPEIIVYAGINFTGESLEVRGTLLDLPKVKAADGTEFDWNDSIRSIKVLSGTWRLYQHGRINKELDETPLEVLDISKKASVPGWSCLLSATSAGAREVPAPEAGSFGLDVSSVELVSDENLPDWATR